MSRAVKITLIVLITVILIAAVMFLIWALLTKPAVIFGPATPAPSLTPTQPAGLPTTIGGVGEVTEPVATEEVELPFELGSTEEIERQKVISTSTLFAERFGSFSNQGDFQNIEDLMPLMTSGMQRWAEDYMEQGRAQASPDDPFYGITTKMLTAKIINFNTDTGRAEVNVDTQRRESKAGEPERIYYQSLKLNLVKSDKNWLIDEATWR